MTDRDKALIEFPPSAVAAASSFADRTLAERSGRAVTPSSSRALTVGDQANRRVIELFAGVGGFRLGLERSGWEIVWSNQWEPSTRMQHAFNCYVERFGGGVAVCEDIHDVMNEAEAGRRAIPDHELLVGSFPGQDFSVARTTTRAAGFVALKGVLWWQVHRLLVMKRPPYLFFESVDRLQRSPTAQRGRDFGVMLAALGSLGYEVEWRVLNAADYGFPQERRRVLLIGRHVGTVERDPNDVLYGGPLARALPVAAGPVMSSAPTFVIDGTPADVSESFGATNGGSPFRNAGFMSQRRVWTLDVEPVWDGASMTLGDILEPTDEVPEQYFIPADELTRWEYLKGAKREQRYHRVSGTHYFYTEEALPYPDRTDRPARAILTGEGGPGAGRFKHLVQVENGRYRRLTPRELERLNGFPDDWTATGMPDRHRAFIMGNALVIGLIERVGSQLMAEMTAAP